MEFPKNRLAVMLVLLVFTSWGSAVRVGSAQKTYAFAYFCKLHWGYVVVTSSFPSSYQISVRSNKRPENYPFSLPSLHRCRVGRSPWWPRNHLPHLPGLWEFPQAGLWIYYDHPKTSIIKATNFTNLILNIDIGWTLISRDYIVGFSMISR